MKKLTLSRNNIDPRITELINLADHKTLAIWALDCAEHVLPFFEDIYPEDTRPKIAIQTGREWVKTGKFSMSVIRKASLDSHSAAREAINEAARFAARAAGQAVATAHVQTHAPGALLYGLKVIQEKTDSEEEVAKEREWQYQQLRSLIH